MKKIALSLIAVCCALAACSTSTSKKADVLGQATPVAPVKKSERPTFNEVTDSIALTGFNNNPNVRNFIQHEAATGVMSEAQLQNFFDNVVYKGNIINIMNRPGTSRPWYEFQKGNVSEAKINAGRRFYAANRQVIDAAAARYGVPASIIVGILGIETNYGSNMGSFRLADALSTLAFDYPRRAEFFQKELHNLFLVAKEENRDPFSFKGSYAGAMGMPQFMPSSFLQYAVDSDGDGQHDIWNNVGDAAASVANYMKQHGWQTGGKVVVPVALLINPQLQSIIDDKTSLKYTVGDFKRMGVTPLENVSDNELAVLYRLETAPNQYEYYLGLNNFYTIWQYNHSRMYVTAVRDIANGVSGGDL